MPARRRSPIFSVPFGSRHANLSRLIAYVGGKRAIGCASGTNACLRSFNNCFARYDFTIAS